MIHYSEQRVGIFMDVQNLYYSARHLFQRKVNFANIVSEAAGNRKLIRALAYVVRTKTGEESAFIDALQSKGIETKERELLEYTSGQKKADWDVGITLDIVKMLDMLDVIIIVSGDGDFVPLVEYCQSRGRQVEVWSFRESSSTKLVEAVDGYVDLSADKKKFLIGSPIRDALKSSKQRVEDDVVSEIGEFEGLAIDDEPEEKVEERRGRKMSF